MTESNQIKALDAMVEEWMRRADEGIVGMPREHCAALLEVALPWLIHE